MEAGFLQTSLHLLSFSVVTFHLDMFCFNTLVKKRTKVNFTLMPGKTSPKWLFLDINFCFLLILQGEPGPAYTIVREINCSKVN